MNEHQPRGDVPARDRLSAAVDATKFRDAMSRLGAAVHVVTTAGPAGNAGFTATAVTSVSDEPATLLVCLKRRSRITPVLRANGVFCVNTLAADMQDIADLFAGRTGIYMAERFAGGTWQSLTTGSPALKGAVAAFDCRIVEAKSVASHDVYFGTVVDMHFGRVAPTLHYHGRAYKQL